MKKYYPITPEQAEDIKEMMNAPDDVKQLLLMEIARLLAEQKKENAPENEKKGNTI